MIQLVLVWTVTFHNCLAVRGGSSCDHNGATAFWLHSLLI